MNRDYHSHRGDVTRPQQGICQSKKRTDITIILIRLLFARRIQSIMSGPQIYHEAMACPHHEAMESEFNVI
jgi:hypothetical protein